MRHWKLIVTDDVQNDLDSFVYYLLVEKSNQQAARALLDDYDETIDALVNVAGTLKKLEDPEINNYRKIRFRRHDYYLLYRIEKDVVIVDHMFHDLQDMDKVFR